MTDIFLPVSLDVARIRLRKIEYVGVSRNPYNGTVRRALRGGDKFGGSIELTPQGGASTTSRSKRRRMIATLVQAGKYNTLLVYDPSYAPAGSFSAPELLANTSFNGTTGWAGAVGNEILSAADGVLRVTKSATGAGSQAAQSSVACVQYAPYVARFFVTTPQAWAFSAYIDSTGSAIGQGMAISSNVPTASTFGTVSVFAGNAGSAGDYFDIHYASASRCALADDSPNLLTYSDQFDNAAWTKQNSTITANDIAAPDGSTTADALVENTTGGLHGVQQSSAVTSSACDLSASFCIKAGTRSWAIVAISDTITHAQGVYVNLSTGALGSFVQDGTNVTNPRAFVTSVGGGWYKVDLVVRKSGSQTAMYGVCAAATGDGGRSYSGTAAAKATYIWRGAVAVSSVPFKPSQTTSSAVGSGTSQTGSAIYIKGLPVSTSGLLEIGDAVEICTSLGSQYGILTARLNSDAAGLGVLQVWPAIRGTVADNAVVYVKTPMLRVIMPDGVPEYLTEPGLISTGGAIDFEECAS